MSITVYGASDDLIEVEGDISEEFPYKGDDEQEDRGDLLAFSDGTILRITFTASGVWRIAPVVLGTAHLNIEQAPENDEDNYTDRAVLIGVEWVVQGTNYATTGGAK